MRKITRSKTGNKRRFYYIFGVLAICTFMSFGIGYALITDTLDVNGTAQITSTWKVLFTKAVENEMNGATTVSRPVITGGTSLKLGVELDEPGSQAIYDVTVANQGTIDAKVTGITFNDGEPSDLVLEVSDFYTGFVLKAGETKTFQVVATWDANAPASDEMDKNVEVDIDFTQNTGEDTGPELSMPTYSVDYPNTTWTTEKNVTITYPEGDGFIYLYSLDGGKIWKTAPTANYTIKFTENGTLYIRVSNGTSFLQTPLITIEKVDSVAPTVEILGNPTAWVKETTVRTSVSDSGGSGLASQAYSWTQGASWTSQNYRLITKNGNYSVWVRDNAGNITKVDFEVTKIDSDLPTINSFTRSTVTSSSITVNVRATQNKMGIAGYRFRINNGAWTSQQTSSTYTFTGLDKDTTYSIQAQAVGKNGKTRQSSTLRVTTNDIATPTYTMSENGDGTKTVKINYSGTKTSNLVYEYSTNNGSTWTTVSGSSVNVLFESAGSVIARVRDTGNADNTVTASAFTVTFEKNYLMPYTDLSSLETLEFVNYLAPGGTSFVDVSLAQDGSIQLWTDSDGNSYIGSNRKIYASPEAIYVFGKMSGSSSIKSIEFNDYFDTSDAEYMAGWFQGCDQLETLDLSGWDTSKVTDMSSMFHNAKKLTSLNVTGWDTGNVTNMQHMFYYNSSLTSLDLSSWDTSKVTNMSRMFYYTSVLSNLNVSGWNTSKVTDMSYMFYYARGMTCLELSSWDTGSVTNMSYMFYFANKLTSLNVTGWDTGNVTNMNYMFAYDSALTTLNVSDWDTSKVINMSRMFYYTTNLTTLDVSDWNTANVTNMSYMFAQNLVGNKKLTTLDVSNWNTSKVTNMSYMFYYLRNLKQLNFSNWNTANVTNMSNMFTYCESLTSITFGTKWNTSKVTNMSYMFGYTKKITSLDVADWNTSKVTDMSDLFTGMESLRTLDISNWDTTSLTNISEMFQYQLHVTTSLVIRGNKLTKYDNFDYESGSLNLTLYSDGTNETLVKKIVDSAYGDGVVYGGVKS